MTKLTNNAKGPRAVHTVDQGYVTLAPGESRDDLNVDPAYAKEMKRTRMLEDDAARTPSREDVKAEVEAVAKTEAKAAETKTEG